MRGRILPVLRRTLTTLRRPLWWAAVAASTPLLAAQALADTGSLTATNLTVTNLTAQTITLGGVPPPTSTNLRLQGNQYAFTPEGTNATRRANNLRTGYTTATTLAPATYMRALTSSVPADLALWWSFEEGGGTTLADASGNGHSGSAQGDPLPVWTKGVTSDAVSFDCAQNYIGSDQPISQTFTAATLECWFLADCVSGENPPLVGTAHDDNPVYGQGDIGSLLIFTPDNHPTMGYMIYFGQGGHWLAASTNALDGQYHHAAGVWDGSQMRLYYDGELVATTNASISPVEANCYLRAAYRDTNGGCYLGGIIGETRLYDRALSSDEVAADYNTDTVGDGIPDWWRLKYFGSGTGTNELSCASCDPNQDSYSNLQEYQNGTDPLAGIVVPANLLVKWTFDEGNGRALGDVSGNGHNGTLAGDPAPTWTNGVTSGALSFDGAQNYVQSDQAFDETIAAFTIECWFAGSTVSGENPVIIGTAGDDFGSDYLGDIVIYDDSIAVEAQSLRTGTNLSLLDGQWHHVAGVWDGSDVRLYLDGQVVASDARAYSPFPWQTPVRLAYRNTNGGCNYGGNIGEVCIYDRALSSDEVATNYNVDTIGDGIPNWWRMKYFDSGTTTNGSSCAACASTNPWAHGLANLQVYENPSVLITDNYSTVGDGIPDWWKVTYGFSLTDPNVANDDPSGDGYTILEDYLNGTNPNVSNVPPVFVINNGTFYAATLGIPIQSTSMNYPNILVGLDSSISNATLLANSGSPAVYTLPDNGDGEYELFLRYADTQGQPRSPVVTKAIIVDRTPPVVQITSPASDAVLDQAFITLQAEVADPNPAVPDAERPLNIWINGQPCWDRNGTNVVIERFPVPAGTNSFTVTIQAVDQAGNTNTASQTWAVNTSTATNAPNLLSVNLSSPMLLPNVDSIWVEGTVDNDYAIMSAIVFAASGDVTTNLLNVRQSRYEGLVPLESGTNQLVLVASDAAGNANSNTYTIISSTEFSGAITSPAFGAFATMPSNTVSGYVSALFDAGLPTQTNVVGVLINGVAAVLDWGDMDSDGNVPFTTTNAIPLYVPITGTLVGDGLPTDPPPSIPPAMSQVYEVTHKETWTEQVPLLEPEIASTPAAIAASAECDTETRGTYSRTSDASDTDGQLQVVTINEADSGLVCNYDLDDVDWQPLRPPSVQTDSEPGPESRALSFGTLYDDDSLTQGSSPTAVYVPGPCCCISLPIITNCVPDVTGNGVCHGYTPAPYGSICYWDPRYEDCSTLERFDHVLETGRNRQRERDRGLIRFRAPRQYSTNTTVIFTFEGVDYGRADGAALDLSQIKFRGLSPVAYSNETQTVSYLITVDGGKEYTISQDDFDWPGAEQNYHYSDLYCGEWQGQCWSSVTQTTEQRHWLSWTNFHNAVLTLTMYVDQPVPGTRLAWAWGTGNVGHAWWALAVSPTNETADIVPTNLRPFVNKPAGYYPNCDNLLPCINPTCNGVVIVPDNGHAANVSKSFSLGLAQLLSGLSYTKSLNDSPGTYNLNTNNCADATLGAAAAAGTNIQSRAGSWFPCGGGHDPGDLGEDLKLIR
jgi:hypothetical protein